MISAVVITYNEEKNIRGCLESLKWVDEIILVDSKSIDKTLEIAKEYTNQIFIQPWPGRCSPQRNFGLQKALGEWIIIVDADERVTLEAQDEIMAWVNSPASKDYAAVQVPRRNYFFGKWLRYGGVFPDLNWRILKKGKVTYDENTNDTPLVEGQTKILSQPFDHFTGEDLSTRFRKLRRNAHNKARERIEMNQKVNGFDFIIRPLGAFIKLYIIKQGFRDGIEGFIYCALESFSTFIRYVKIWESSRV